MDQSCLCYDNPASWPARGKHPANPKNFIFILVFIMAMFITYSLKARGRLNSHKSYIAGSIGSPRVKEHERASHCVQEIIFPGNS